MYVSRSLSEAYRLSSRQIWDLKTYKIKLDLPGHTDEVYCVDFVADKVVSGGRDKVVKMYVSLSYRLIMTSLLMLHPLRWKN